MKHKVMVTYGSKYGATAGIAEKIAETLRGAGLDTDLMDAKNVRDLTPYSAVVLGSAVYIGSWRKEAANLLKENRALLAKRSVWLFSSGPTEEGDTVEAMEGWTMPAKLKPIIESIQPQDITIFKGAVFPERMSFIEKWMLKNVKAPLGDFRDWDSIETWAASIAAVLKDTRPV